MYVCISVTHATRVGRTNFWYSVPSLRQLHLLILRGYRPMLSFCMHHIYMDNISPAPHTTWGSPELIARHQHGHWYNSVQRTTKQQKSICERRNARPHSRSRPARPQTITCDCPGHPDRHRPTCPHAAAQSMPKAVAQRHSPPPAPQLPFRRRGIVLPRDRPARHGCKLVCWFCRVRRSRAVRRSLG